MVLYLGFLLVLGAWGVGNWSLLWRGLAIVAIYTVLDLALSKRREGKFIAPSSAWISGLILSLVLAPAAPWLAVLFAPVVASLGKHFIRYKQKHIFNPAASALVLLGFLFPSAAIVSWWGSAWGRIPLVVIVLSGIVTMFRVKRWKTALAFLVVYVVGASALLLSRGGSVADLRALFVDGTLFFFATVMLIEPVTTAYQPAWLRTAFGAGVAVLTLLFSLPGGRLPIPDPFLVSLLISNLGATSISMLIRR
ncbi:MAG: hypothetical protein G01um101438_190 [Parcubacteria group bacterium Gr01-1014_38]|nr:MAG: hypothetical protein G01um101438_190 [Parcubacteria group bacterium Gr01-1014_38]